MYWKVLIGYTVNRESNTFFYKAGHQYISISCTILQRFHSDFIAVLKCCTTAGERIQWNRRWNRIANWLLKPIFPNWVMQINEGQIIIFSHLPRFILKWPMISDNRIKNWLLKPILIKSNTVSSLEDFSISLLPRFSLIWRANISNNWRKINDLWTCNMS